MLAMAVKAVCEYCGRMCVIQTPIPNLLLFLVLLLHKSASIWVENLKG
jgi:hypothetical protein